MQKNHQFHPQSLYKYPHPGEARSTHHFILFLSSKLAFSTHLHIMSSLSTNSSEGAKGAMWNSLQASMEEAMLSSMKSRRAGPSIIDATSIVILSLLMTDFIKSRRAGPSIFLSIMLILDEYSPYFTQREDVLGRLDLSPLQKCTVAMRLLAYGSAADSIYEYLKLARSTALEYLKLC
jgi:hypothetical protein